MISEGDFFDARLVSQSGKPLITEVEFIDELAERIMARYESLRGQFLVIRPVRPAPDRTKSYYKRLFDPDTGAYGDSFRTLASETMTRWAEESLESAFHAQAGPLENNDPAFDVLSVVRLENDELRLRVVQTKATKDNLQNQCTLAVNSFAKLEAGEYDAILHDRLILLEDKGVISSGMARELLTDERTYRVTAFHAEDRDKIKVLTTYSSKLPGTPERRTARFVHIEWPSFWDALAARIFEQLT
jgi:hypothetical protein